MSIILNLFGVGDGISVPSVGTFRWNAHAFNPTGNTDSLYQTFNIYENTIGYWEFDILNQRTTFDLTGFQYGNEVAFGLLSFTNIGSADTFEVTVRWRDPDGSVVFSNYFPVYLDPDWGTWVWSGIGIKAYPTNEIWKAGTYRFEYTITATGIYESDYISFDVINFPTLTYSTAVGSIWVEGEHLAYICNQRHKILMRPDGPQVTYAGTSYSGSIWVDLVAHGKISYVDADGYVRRTKRGDRYGVPSWDATELPNAPGSSKSGSIWISNWIFDTYIMIISADGNAYRLGAGYVFGGDYQ